ncbi:hypothetical protein PCCS19_50050 [Paenibacillus sp. CCS19]|uniref:vWA domain-containing protein n=1 Tax=Paenibacillus sp. CCS19 TaxID=3158387 RepID=UPI0025633CE6|nr:vWA domain-containing protein [Paenibacillus cellulosilyticus]GMK41946.1 hypothetical protein PCCS19_50050 [Paenibacillus cellulosilyticus]
MANELVLKPELNTPYLLNDNKERQVKVKLTIHPSDEIRMKKDNVPTELGTDVCLVLDVSGSMRDIIAGEVVSTGQTVMIEGQLRNIVTGGTSKLDCAISAVQKLLPKLRDNDTLSLVAYEDNSHIIFKGYKKNQQKEMLQKLEECRRYSGNTNISGALREARVLLKDIPGSRPKKIIFLTDGNPVGDTEEAGIHEGEMLAEYNITIDCLGIGDDFNLAFINRIAAPSKGRTNLIETPEDAERIFTELFEKSQDVLATNLELHLRFSPQVRVTEHYRGVPENMYLGKVRMPQDDRTVTLKLGQVETHQRYEYFFLITVPPQEGYNGMFRLMQAEATYYLPGITSDKEITKKSIAVEFGDKSQFAQRRNGEVESGYSQAEIMRLLTEAEDALKKSKNGEAGQKYQLIIDKYMSLGMVEEAKLYREMLSKFQKTGQITLSDLNKAHSTSSKAADSGEISPLLDEEDEDFIFGR